MTIAGLLVGAWIGCTTPEYSANDGDFVPRGEVTLTPAAEVVTYYTAAWSSELSGRTRLEIDDGQRPVLVTDWQEGPNAEAVPVLGLWGEHEFTARLVDEEGGLLATSTFTTGAGPTELSAMTTEGTASWEGYAITEIASSSLQTVVVLAPNGRPVWYWQTSGSYVSRASLRRDGRGLWLLGMPELAVGQPGWIGSVAWDGTMLLDIVPYGHEGEGCTHDVFELEDGRLVFLGPDTRQVDGVAYAGDTLFALNPDGSETALWSVWDDFSPDDRVLSPLSWTHANALRWNDERRTLWVGLRDLNALVELDPETWRPINEFGGPRPTFLVPDGTIPPKQQHQFAFHEGRLAIHDNRDAEIGSRVVIYDLDFDAATPEIAQTWEYVPDPTVFDFVMGDVSWLDDESLLVTWSTTGRLEERRLDGSSPWSIVLDLGSVFPYTQRIDALPGATPVSGG